MGILSKISATTDQRSAHLAGIALMLAGVAMFSSGDALGKGLVARYPVTELLLLRAAVPLAIVLAATQFTGTFTVGLAMAPFAFVAPALPDLGLFLLAGCISILALLCTNRSLILAPASVVAPYQYSMILWAMLFGYAAFGDVPS